MTVCCLFGLQVILGTAAGGPAGPMPSDALCIMTYNLRYAAKDPGHDWEQRRPIASDLIRTVAPDVIGTQEGLYGQLKDLRADLPDYAWIGLGRDGGSRGEFMAVFYKKQRLDPMEYDHFWLSDTPEVIASASWGNHCRRMVTWVRFRDLRTRREFYLFNTHFDHQSARAREKSAALVLQRIKDLKTPLPVVLTGDFNEAALSSRPYRILVDDGGLVDAWTTAKQRGELISTFHGYRRPVKGGPRIDWILLLGPVASLSSEIVTFSKDGEYPSDHFPVTARVRLEP